MRVLCLSLILLAALPALSLAQPTPSETWAARALNQYQLQPDITYLTANGYEAKLDMYRRRGEPGPFPTLIYIHGGGWVGGSKEAALLYFIPYLAMGWNVVSVEYRLARVSPAPAAVEDCLCALKWASAQARRFDIDAARLVVSGESAGATSR